MSDPASAHREEILEGIIDAAFKGDIEKFHSFNEEWDRLTQTEEKNRLKFGEPSFYQISGWCDHCHSQWVSEGISFGEFKIGIAVDFHMLKCPERTECLCWSGLSDEDGLTYPLCQKCFSPEPECECEDGITLGPCASLIRKYDQKDQTDINE